MEVTRMSSVSASALPPESGDEDEDAALALRFHVWYVGAFLGECGPCAHFTGDATIQYPRK